MRHLKTLTLAAMAVFVLMALAGAGTASATRLCTTNTSPCPEANIIPFGTTINFALKSFTSAVLTTSSGISNPKITCNTSTLMFTTTGSGGSGSVSVDLDSLTLSSCTSANPSGCSTSGTIVGTLPQAGSVNWAGLSDGTLGVLAWPQVQFTCPTIFGNATCKFGANTVDATIHGGNPAVLEFNAPLDTGGSLCPAFATFSATYNAQSPMSAIWVTNS